MDPEAEETMVWYQMDGTKETFRDSAKTFTDQWIFSKLGRVIFRWDLSDSECIFVSKLRSVFEPNASINATFAAEFKGYQCVGDVLVHRHQKRDKSLNATFADDVPGHTLRRWTYPNQWAQSDFRLHRWSGAEHFHNTD